MRCPYCGGLNSDQASYCVRCGRIFSQTPTNAPRPFAPSAPPAGAQRTVYPPTQTTQRPGQPYPARPAGPQHPPLPRPNVYPPNPSAPPVQPVPPAKPQQGQVATPSAAARPTAQRPAAAKRMPYPANIEPVSAPIPPAPEPPVEFPPRKIAQLTMLAQEGLDYTVLDDNEGYGKKKIVRIQYRRCVPWQQVATLLKALKAYQDTRYDTIIIQGVYNQERDVYEYTNGQLIFNRNVRLGSQIQDRYQIETDNGYSSQAQRMVLAE